MCVAKELTQTDFEYMDNRDKQKVLVWLRNSKASFISEIAWETGMNEYSVRNVLNALWSSGFIEMIPTNFYDPDPRLLLRVPDMSNRGQAGYANFAKRRWFGLTEKGFEQAKGDLVVF